MYTITVKISDRGTILTKEDGTSVTGHMWYSLSENGVSTGSYGFAPEVHGESFGEGEVYRTDDANYASNYYTGEIVITSDQYKDLQAFGVTGNLDGKAPYYYDFSSYYNGLTNSCIDYTWKALNIIGINPTDFEGQTWPTWNADDADATLYKYLMGDTTDWNESLPDAGGYDAIYGSSGNDDLRSHNNTDALYGGSGNDDIYGNSNSEKIFGGTGDDFVDGGWGNDYIEGNEGNDDLLGFNGSDIIDGGLGNDFIDGGELHDKLIGGENEDILVGGSGSDTLLGQSGNDVLAGGNSLDDLYSEKEFDYLSGGTGFDTYLVSHQDVINDADSNGLIMFNDKSLSGTKKKIDEYSYEDTNFTYTLDGPNMIVVDKNLGEYITIENFNFNSGGMGMNFDDGTNDPTKKDVEIYVGDATVTEGGTLEFTVAIDNTLEKDLVLNIGSYFSGSADTQDLQTPMNGTITIKAGETSGTFTIDTVDDEMVESSEDFTFSAHKYVLVNNRNYKNKRMVG